jgi:hypothetical protein
VGSGVAAPACSDLQALMADVAALAGFAVWAES